MTTDPSPIHSSAPWQAVEIHLDTNTDTKTYHGEPISRAIARIFYRALYEQGLSSVCLLAVSGQSRERYFLRPLDQAQTPPSDPPAIGEPVRALIDPATSELPVDIGLTVVSVDTAPIGTAAVPVHRLITSTHRTFDGSSDSDSTPFEQLLSAYLSEATPHAIQLHAVKTGDEMFEVSIRVADFSSAARSEPADANVRWHADAPAIAEFFESFQVTTNRELPFEHGWTQTHETRLPEQSVRILKREHNAQRNDHALALSRELSRTPAEYRRLFSVPTQDAALRSKYATLGVDPWVHVSAERLPALCGLVAGEFTHSPWDALPDRSGPTVTTHETVRDTASIDRRDETRDTQPTPSPSTLGVESRLGSLAIQWFRQQGDRITALANSGPFEGFYRESPTAGSARCVVITDPEFCPGDLIAVATQAHTNEPTQRVTVLADSTPIAKRAVDCLQRPFRISTNARTRLYPRSKPLKAEIKIAVRPTDTTCYWELTPDDELRYRHEQTVITATSRETPRSELACTLPTAWQRNGQCVVADAHGDVRSEYDTPEALMDEWISVREPAVPTWLSTGLEFATVFTADQNQLREYRLQADWDRPLLSGRNLDAADAFVRTFTVHAPGDEIVVSQATPLFIAWLRHQTLEKLGLTLDTALYRHTDTNSEGRRNELIRDRAWRYTP